MRHKRIGRKLGVTTKHRKAMFRNMVTDLFRYDKIKTTDTRAKELRRIAEKLITLAKDGSLHKRRQAAAYIRDNEVLKKLFEVIAPKFKDRPGGYTRIIKLGFRKGDNSPISIIELVEEEFKPAKKKKAKAAPKKQETTAKAKSGKKESAEELGLIEEKAAEAPETPAAEAAAPEEAASAPETPAEEAAAPEAAAEPAAEPAPEPEAAPEDAPKAETEDKKE
jgi:large subunit ribosomal protein L17